MYKDLMDQENAILMENQSLWEKVFLSPTKGMTTQEDGKNTVISCWTPLNPPRTSLPPTS